MLIKPKALTHWINHFYGYGSWSAPIWFVAHEESGGDLPEEVAEKLDYFQDEYHHVRDATLCDVRAVYQKVRLGWEGPKANVYKNRYDYRFGERAVLNKVWENLIRFTCGYYDTELPEMLDYQRNKFATVASNENLLRLYPLPGASHHGWNYNWLDLGEAFNFLKSREHYEKHLYQDRISRILEAMQIHKPALVLMYGMNNINQLKQSVLDFFPGTRFTLNKKIKLKIPQHHHADVNGTKFLITTQIPALRHNRIESGFDWYSFGELVRA